jgi:hypothetical protein
MDNGIGTLLATKNPKPSDAASKEGKDFVGFNQDVAVLRQFKHLLWSSGGIELTPQLWVIIHPTKEVMQGIKWR